MDPPLPTDSRALVRAADVLEEEGAFERLMRKAKAKADDLGDRMRPPHGGDQSPPGGASRDPHEGHGEENLHRFLEHLRTAFRLLQAYRTGDYRDVDRVAVLVLVASIMYFVNPFDIVPDVIPGVGCLDDAAVMAFAASLLQDELERFSAWEASS